RACFALTKSKLKWALSRLFVDRHFSANEKNEVCRLKNLCNNSTQSLCFYNIHKEHYLLKYLINNIFFRFVGLHHDQPSSKSIRASTGLHPLAGQANQSKIIGQAQCSA